jgi:hypothetical protein
LSVFSSICRSNTDVLEHSEIPAKTTDNRQPITDNSAVGAPATENRKLTTDINQKSKIHSFDKTSYAESSVFCGQFGGRLFIYAYNELCAMPFDIF